MLNVLLIEANSAWLFKRDDLIDLEVVLLPIGLMYIATYLRHKLGSRVNIRILDKFLDCESQEDLVRVLKDFKPDVVGIRGQDIFKKEFHETAAIVKDFKNSITLVGGGPYVTVGSEEVAGDKNIDYFVIGEGEVTFTELIEKLMNHQDTSDIKGIAYRNNRKIIITAPRPFIENLDELPFPDYNFISIDKYKKFLGYGYNRRKQAVIFTSRGCPYSCIYCHNIFGKKMRARSPENVFQEIERLYKDYDIKNFYFVDDNFNFDYRRAMNVFDLIINSGIKIRIYLGNGLRGDLVDRNFIDKMFEAGVVEVVYAVETASVRLQKFIKKFLNLEKLAENIHYTCEKNIMVGYFAMIGLPSETRQEALQTIEYLKQFKKVVLPYILSVKYYFNTKLFDLGLKYGIKIDTIKRIYTEPFHRVSFSETPLISNAEFRWLFYKFQKEVILSKERLLNAIEIQKKFMSKQEILDMYSVFCGERIRDLEKDFLLFYAK